MIMSATNQTGEEMQNSETTVQQGNYQRPVGVEPQFDDITAVADQVSRTFKRYAQERPDVVALWCLGIGFVLGWKMKPW